MTATTYVDAWGDEALCIEGVGFQEASLDVIRPASDDKSYVVELAAVKQAGDEEGLSAVLDREGAVVLIDHPQDLVAEYDARQNG